MYLLEDTLQEVYPFSNLTTKESYSKISSLQFSPIYIEFFENTLIFVGHSRLSRLGGIMAIQNQKINLKWQWVC